jgi:hypothetical protein
LQTARKFLDRFDRLHGRPLDVEVRALVLAAALLHDVGHGPFSHVFELVVRQKHEARTLEIIGDPSTEVHRRLRAFDAQAPDRLMQFFDENTRDPDSPNRWPPYLVQVVSSQLDADRCDYLLRDSHATGAGYGLYDLDWLTSQLCLQADGKRFYLSRKALSAAEAYIFARHHMYRTVYFHKTSRAAEVMLQLLFRRYRELLQLAPSVEARRTVVADAPRAVFLAFTEQLSLNQYLALDDHTITEFLEACLGSGDEILISLSDGLLNRRLYKAVDASGASSAAVGEFVASVQPMLPKDSPVAYAFVVDTSKDTPYKPYDPEVRAPAAQIYVEAPTGECREISQVSETVAQLRRPYELVRYYFPELLRARIRPLAVSILGRDKR